MPGIAGSIRPPAVVELEKFSNLPLKAGDHRQAVGKILEWFVGQALQGML
jgi:hypothetical protein